MRSSSRKKPPPSLQVGLVEQELPATSPRERHMAQFFERAHPAGITAACRFVPLDEANDAVQQVALRFFERWEQLSLDQKTVGYFVHSVLNELRNVKRTERRRGGPYVDLQVADAEEFAYPQLTTPSPLAVLETRSDYEYALRMLDSMADGPRQACTSMFVDGMTANEAATIHGWAPKTVRSHASRGMKWLRTAFAERLPELGASPAPALPAAPVPALPRAASSTAALPPAPASSITEVDHD